jgi:Leucine-rich repeat (LRR) protein
MLTSVAGLGRVTRAANLSIGGNSALQEISGLEAMSIEESLDIRTNHPSIARLGDFAGVKNPQYVTIEGPFTELEGLSHLESVVEIQIQAPLTTLAGLRNLATANSISLSQTRLTNLAGLENLVLDLSGGMGIYENPLLRNLTGLSPEINELGMIQVSDNPDIVSLTGLEALTSLFQLYVAVNDSLTSLAGLENLSSLDMFFIEENANLASLSALESLMSVDGEFAVVNNPRLPTCEIRALYAVTGGEPLTIMGNQGPTNCP